MALPAVAAAATSFAPSIFKFFAGRSQVRQANRINPVNPGFVANPAFANNERILRERSNNYVMPGYGNAMNNIVTNGATAFSNGVEGATSGADVLDLASKINYGTGQNLNELAQTNATGANDALNQYMQASVMSGNELVRKNTFKRRQFLSLGHSIIKRSSLLKSKPCII